uniref:Ig-like domain-containing protein n=1 Tax=Scleropages formosus TaxID=113540 RepID=A0A8C9RIL9_SCLFO
SSAVADKTVYSSVGSGVTLPCTQVPHANCSSTTWLYSEDFRTTRTVFEDGTMKLRKERLSVDSACSLRIANVSVEDRGKYTCRKFVNGERRGADTRVLLCVLSGTFPSTLSALQCVLLPCGGPASCSGHNTMSLRWVDGTGTEIQNDLRYEEQKSSCNITLSVKQKRADSNGERTCQLVDGSEVKTSRSYPGKIIWAPLGRNGARKQHVLKDVAQEMFISRLLSTTIAVFFLQTDILFFLMLCRQNKHLNEVHKELSFHTESVSCFLSRGFGGLL